MRISSVPIYGHIAASKAAAWDDYEEAQYHKLRFYSECGRGTVIPFPGSRPANDREGPIECRERLGGLLKYDHRKAA